MKTIILQNPKCFFGLLWSYSNTCPTALSNQMKRFGRALLNLYLQDRIYNIMWKNFDRQSFIQIFSKVIFVLNVMVQLNSLIERSKNASNDRKNDRKPDLVMTIPAKTFLLECCAWPSISSENRSMTNFPIRSATVWGRENSETGIEVPENP